MEDPDFCEDFNRELPVRNARSEGKHFYQGRWTAAILRRLEARSRERGVKDSEELDRLADALIDKCISGDIAALKEFGDRVEGKVKSTVDANVSGSMSVLWPLPKTPLDQ